MHSDSDSDPEYLDDALADFTDQLMRGTASDDLGQETGELSELQATAQRIKGVFDASRPDREVAQRIHTNLAQEWKRLYSNKAEPSAWQRIWQRIAPSQSHWLSRRRRRRAYAFSLAGLAIAILIAALVLQVGGVSLPGAVPDDAPLVIISVIAIGGLGVLSWWLLRRR